MGSEARPKKALGHPEVVVEALGHPGGGRNF